MKQLLVIICLMISVCSCDNNSRKVVPPWEKSKYLEDKNDTTSQKRDSVIESSSAKDLSSRSYGGTYDGTVSYDDDDEEAESATSKYANDGHPGTKPDDPLFGFDPYDDEDDAYDVERNQVDPYPDEW